MRKYTFDDIKIGDIVKTKNGSGTVIKLENITFKNNILNKNPDFSLDTEITIYLKNENKFYSCNLYDIISFITKNNEKINIFKKIKNMFFKK